MAMAANAVAGGGGGGDPDSFQYRDRAKERRQKFGPADTDPKESKLKQRYLASLAEQESMSTGAAAEQSIGESNKGNKMLQKMGWKDGQGLGRSNQGRTDIIETHQRSALAGLGSSGQSSVANPNETYKDTVKRALYSRYNDLDQ